LINERKISAALIKDGWLTPGGTTARGSGVCALMEENAPSPPALGPTQVEAATKNAVRDNGTARIRKRFLEVGSETHPRAIAKEKSFQLAAA